MKQLSAVLLLAISFITNADSMSVAGKWNSVNEDTQEVTGLWDLRIEDNTLRGYLVDYPDAKPSDKCDKCTGAAEDFLNSPIMGTAWLQLNAFKSGKWQDGFIIDSRDGKKYKAKAWLEDGKLKLRGYVGFFYRTQEWQRAKEQ